MKLIEHKNIVKPNAMTLQTLPLVVWLDKYTELHIMKGDSVLEIVCVVQKFWMDLANSDALQLVAFWFALGARVRRGTTGPWTKAELSPNPRRRYLRD